MRLWDGETIFHPSEEAEGSRPFGIRLQREMQRYGDRTSDMIGAESDRQTCCRINYRFPKHILPSDLTVASQEMSVSDKRSVFCIGCPNPSFTHFIAWQTSRLPVQVIPFSASSQNRMAESTSSIALRLATLVDPYYLNDIAILAALL